MPLTSSYRESGRGERPMHPAQLERWEVENVGYVDVTIDSDGRRHVREAASIIAANLDWLRPRYPEMIQPAGTLQLDTDGEYQYRQLRDLPGPFRSLRAILTAIHGKMLL
jgi:hypothetical protein